MDGASYTLSKQYTDERMKNSPSPLFGTSKTPWEIYKQIPYRAGSYQVIDDATVEWTGGGGKKVIDGREFTILRDNAIYSEREAKKTFALPLVVTDSYIMFSLYIDNIETVQRFGLFFDSGATTGNYYSKTWYAPHTVLHTGMNVLVTNKENLVAVGTPSWDNINTIRVNVWKNTGVDSATVYMGGIGAYTPNSALVTIEFDDGHITQYTEGFSKMNGMVPPIPGCISVNSNTVDKSGRITRQQMQEIKNAGWGLYNHTASHPHLTELTEDELENEVLKCTEYLLSHFPDKGAFHMTPPYGAVNDDVLNMIKKYGISCRYKYGLENILPVLDPYGLAVKSINDAVTVETIKDWIDTCIVNQTWLILLVHTIADTGADITPENFQLVLDYITEKVNAGQLKTVTRSEGLSSF